MIHGNGGHIRAFALSWPICGKHSVFLAFVCGLSDDPAAGPDAVCRMVSASGGCRTLSHLHFQREAQRLRCSRPGMGNGKRSTEIYHEVPFEAGASSFGVYCHSCRLHQERRCSVSPLPILPQLFAAERAPTVAQADQRVNRQIIQPLIFFGVWGIK